MAKKQKKTTNKFYKILSFILVFITVLAVNVIIYFNVLPNKYLIPAVIVVGLLTLVIALFLNKKTKIFAKLICTIASVLILVIEALGIFYAFGTIDFFNDIFDNGVRSESYAIYVKEDSTFKTVNDIKRRNIAVFNPICANANFILPASCIASSTFLTFITELYAVIPATTAPIAEATAKIGVGIEPNILPKTSPILGNILSATADKLFLKLSSP